MNTDDTLPPPPQDPFDRIAAMLAQMAAGMVQIAGELQTLKRASQPQQEAPPPPAPEPLPEKPEQQDEPKDEEPEKQDGEPADPQDGEESDESGDQGEPTPSDAQEAAQDEPAEEGQGEESQESADASEGQEMGEDADDTQDAGEAEGEGTQGEGARTDEAQDTPEGDEDSEPEHPEAADHDAETQPEDEAAWSEHGDGGEQDGSSTDGGDGSKGTAALLPPDLPPLDSTLASCSPPPPPSMVPYRPLTARARRVADMLAAALGKRHALARPDRSTGSLDGAAVARHSAQPFRRRPRMDGHRPKINVLVDTSGSMSEVHRNYGNFLIDGLLEASRRRVIDLSLYNTFYVASSGNSRAAGNKVKDGDGYYFGTDEYGRFDEAQVKRHDPGDQIKSIGAMWTNGRGESFAAALKFLDAEIRAADATILFTDGHWTDGALDKQAFLQRGIEVVGLYILPEAREVRKALASASAKVKPEGLDSFLASFANYKSATFERYAAKGEWRKERAKPERSGTEIARLDGIVWAANERARAAQNEMRQPQIFKSKSAPNEVNFVCQAAAAAAAAAAALEGNSHRSYCVDDEQQAAQAILQEIQRQLASK